MEQFRFLRSFSDIHRRVDILEVIRLDFARKLIFFISDVNFFLQRADDYPVQ